MNSDMVFSYDKSYFVSSGDEEEETVDDDVEDTTRDASSDEEDTEITEVDSEDEETEKEESTDGMEFDSDDDALPFLQKEDSESGDASDDDVLAVSVEKPKSDMLPVLRAAFLEDPVCPEKSSPRMAKLCEQTKMPANVVKFWFDNQLKKQNEETAVTTATTVSNGLLMDGIVKGEEDEETDAVVEDKTKEKMSTDDSSLPETATEKQQEKRDRRKRGRPRKLVAEEPEQTSEATSEGGSSKGGMLESTVKDEEKKKKEEGAKKGKHKTPEQKKVLIAAFEADSQIPAAGSERMHDIRDRTGLHENEVINWFIRRRKIFRIGRTRLSRGRQDKGKEPMATPRGDGSKSSSSNAVVVDRRTEKQKMGNDKHDQTSEATSEGGSSNGEMLDSMVKDEEEKKEEGEGAEKKSGKHKSKTPEQTKLLLAEFETDSQTPISNGARMLELCARTGLEREVVTRWFNDRRANLRKTRKRDERENKEKEGSARDVTIGNSSSNSSGESGGTTSLSVSLPKDDQTSEATSEGGSSNDGMLDSTVKDEEEKKEEEEGAKKGKHKTREQIKLLLAEFETDSQTPSFDSERMLELCARTGLDRRGVAKWFVNRRSNLRRARAREERENEDNEQPMTTPRGDAPKSSFKGIVVDPPMKKRKTGNDGSAREVTINGSNNNANVSFEGMNSPTVSLTSLSLSGSALNNNKKQVSFHTSMPPPPVPLPLSDSNSSNQNPLRDLAKRSVRKCLICGDLCAMPSASIVSMNEASNLDGYYGSSLAQALNFTLRIDVCSVHRELYSRYKRSMANQQ